MNFVVNNPNKFASTIPGALFQNAENSRKAAEASQFPINSNRHWTSGPVKPDTGYPSNFLAAVIVVLLKFCVYYPLVGLVKVSAWVGTKLGQAIFYGLKYIFKDRKTVTRKSPSKIPPSKYGYW